MSTTLQDNRLRAKKRLAKKPAQSETVVSVSFPLVKNSDFGSKTMSVTHRKLRKHTLGRHPAKALVLTVSAQHSIDLIDDVVVLDKKGQRVPRPAYAMLRIDQLPQFKKG